MVRCWLGPSGTSSAHAGLLSGGKCLSLGAQSSHGADSPSAAADQQAEEPGHTPCKENSVTVE